MTPEQKNKIDDMSFETMMYMRRFEPIGSEWFEGDTGDYFLHVFKKKQINLEEGEYTSISKRIGWDK